MSADKDNKADHCATLTIFLLEIEGFKSVGREMAKK